MRKALVIDDDEDCRTVAEAYLEVEGFDVETAENGRKGVEKAKSFKPNLVMIDLIMPGIHGFQVCEEIRADQSLTHARLLVTSSKAFDQDKVSAKAAGADDYLVKPYLRSELREKIKKLFET